MTTDKRTPHTDALDTLGFIIGDTAKRDAIHLAVEPVAAGQVLHPGDHVSLCGGIAWRTPEGEGVGIVDPFLKQNVKPGEKFWLVVYPRQITSLRHVWEHPDFPTPFDAINKRQKSENWLRDFAALHYMDYQTMVAHALLQREKDDEHLHFDGQDAHGDIPPEFWDHIENVTGQKIPMDERAIYFSCSC